MVRTSLEQVDKHDLEFRIEKLDSRQLHKKSRVLSVFDGEVAVAVSADVVVSKVKSAVLTLTFM
jgi:hypothetical protein